MTSLSPVNGIPRPDGTDAKNLVDQFAAFDAVVDTRAVPRFFNAAARAAAIPVPVEGQMAYLQTECLLTYYDGTAWFVMDQPRMKRLASNLVVTTTDAVTVPGLSFPVKANSTYHMEWVWNVLPSPFAGVFQTTFIRLQGPTGATSVNYIQAPTINSGASGQTNMQWIQSETTLNNPLLPLGNTGSAIYQTAKWVGIVTTDSNPGTVTCTAARSSSVTSVTIAANSYVRWTKLT